MKPSKNQIRQLRRDNLAYPESLSDVPREQWPDHRDSMIGVWRSRTFLVQAFQESDQIIRLSVCRTDWDTTSNSWKENIGWDELQRIKGEAGYQDSCAVEVYPAAGDVVNLANMRHLWILPYSPDYVWTKKNRQPSNACMMMENR